MQVFNGLALNPLDKINMPNKQSSTKRFRTDTAIKLIQSTDYLRKQGKTTDSYIVTHALASLWVSLNVSFTKKFCVTGYTAIEIIELCFHQF